MCTRLYCQGSYGGTCTGTQVYCTVPPADCTNVTYELIKAIMGLGDAASAAQLTPIVNAACPTLNLTVTDAEALLTSGARKGIFCLIQAIPVRTYKVDAYMNEMNPANDLYWRGPGCPASFFGCAKQA